MLITSQRFYDLLGFTHRVLPLLPPQGSERIVALLDVHAQQVLGRQVPAALDAPVRVGLAVVHLVVAVGLEGEDVAVRRQRAPHGHR